MDVKRLRRLAQVSRRKSAANTKVGPGGMCYSWSVNLGKELFARGEDVRLVEGLFRTDKVSTPHYWLVVGGWIVDVTASQFNHNLARKLPPIVIAPDGHERYQKNRDRSLHLRP